MGQAEIILPAEMTAQGKEQNGLFPKKLLILLVPGTGIEPVRY